MTELEIAKLLLNGGAGGLGGLALALVVNHFRMREITQKMGFVEARLDERINKTAQDVADQEEKFDQGLRQVDSRFDERLRQMDSRLKTLEDQSHAIDRSVGILQKTADHLDSSLAELKELLRNR